MKLGIITSHNADGIKYVRDLGLGFAEMDVNAENIDYLFAEEAGIAAAMKEHNVSLSAVGRWGIAKIADDGSIIESEQKKEFTLIDFCRRNGCPVYMLTMNYVNSISYFSNLKSSMSYLEALINYAGDDVKVCVVNCHWNNYITGPKEWSIFLGHLPKLGIKFDSSHSINGGGDYRAEAADWGDRFYHVHLKGTINIGGRHIDDPPAGLDMTNWPELISILRAKKYSGVLSLEPHSAVWQGEIGDKGVRYSIDYFKKLLFEV
ncbi:MAG: TIM barrel protein [Eubacteriales bacterium]|nr:TIM barrel protein [Eubacteriales bacterium]MDD4474624.1 TIM barrel protein [Eubacteriales bacterium]